MPTSAVCVDASFVLALVTPEPLSSKALALWERWAKAGVRVLAPCLLRYEVTSVLRRKVVRGLLEPKDAREALRQALSLEIEFRDLPNLSLRAFELAEGFGWAAAYDAHYLALAEAEKAELWTGDERLVRAAQATFPFVHWLGEVQA